MKQLRTGDQVVVLAGNDRGKTGKVLARSKKRVLIEKINLRKKHMKPTEENPKGQIAEIERPIHISNVAFCDDQGKPVKLRVREEGGAKDLVDRDGKVYRTVRKGK